MKPTLALSEWLEHQIQSGDPGQRLPTNVELSSHFGLSQTTVRKVLRGFQERDLLYCVPGKGTFVPQATPEEGEALFRPASSAHNLSRSILRAISRGEIKRGEPLPPVKVMSLQYRVTPATVSAAYRLLVDDGHAMQVGKRYWVHEPADLAVLPGSGRAVLFHHGDASLENFVSHSIWRQGLFEMEAELQACKVRLTYADAAELPSRMTEWQRSQRYPTGIVVASEDADYLAELGNTMERFLAKAGPIGPRVLFSGIRTRHRSKRVYHFSHGHIPTMRARETARFCARHGFHTLCVFINNVPRRPSEPRDCLRLIPELRNFDPDATIRFYIRKQRDIVDAQSYYAALRAAFDGQYLLSLAGKYRATSFRQLEEMITVVDNLHDAYARVKPGALWYFTGDATAADAVEWCRQHGRSIPRDVSILSSYNDARYYHVGLSSCVADWRTIGYLMAHALIGDIPIERTTKGYIRTKVRIYERQTTP
jgi:DNA-binding transcriptional regulator YhcF (GntR family)